MLKEHSSLILSLHKFSYNLSPTRWLPNLSKTSIIFYSKNKISNEKDESLKKLKEKIFIYFDQLYYDR